MVFLQVVTAFSLVFAILVGGITLMCDKVTKSDYFVCWFCLVLQISAYAVEKFI